MRFSTGSKAFAWPHCVRALGTAGIAVVLLGACQANVVPALDVAPGPRTLAVGQNVQLVVTRQFEGGPLESVTDQVRYQPSSGVVSVNPAGLVSAVGPGNVVVRVVDPTTDGATAISFSVVPAGAPTPGP